MYELEQGAVTRAVIDGVAVEIPRYDHERTRGADYSDPSQLPALADHPALGGPRVLDGRAVHDGRRVIDGRSP